MPEIDIVIGGYGVPMHGVSLKKETALKWAEEQVGHTLNRALFPASHGYYKVLSVRLDDYPSDSTKGAIIATCQIVTDYKAMEVK